MGSILPQNVVLKQSSLTADFSLCKNPAQSAKNPNPKYHFHDSQRSRIPASLIHNNALFRR
jgi:hypothetical protein